MCLKQDPDISRRLDLYFIFYMYTSLKSTICLMAADVMIGQIIKLNWLTYTDWLIDRLTMTDWLIDWRTDWLSAWLIDSHWVNNTDWMISWLSNLFLPLNTQEVFTSGSVFFPYHSYLRLWNVLLHWRKSLCVAQQLVSWIWEGIRTGWDSSWLSNLQWHHLRRTFSTCDLQEAPGRETRPAGLDEHSAFLGQKLTGVAGIRGWCGRHILLHISGNVCAKRWFPPNIRAIMPKI